MSKDAYSRIDNGRSTMTEPGTARIANFWRAEFDPEDRDEIEALLREIVPRTGGVEPGFLVQVFHIQEPNVVWAYALFADSDALAEHHVNVANDPGPVKQLLALLTAKDTAIQATPIAAAGL